AAWHSGKDAPSPCRKGSQRPRLLAEGLSATFAGVAEERGGRARTGNECSDCKEQTPGSFQEPGVSLGSVGGCRARQRRYFWLIRWGSYLPPTRRISNFVSAMSSSDRFFPAWASSMSRSFFSSASGKKATKCGGIGLRCSAFARRCTDS